MNNNKNLFTLERDMFPILKNKVMLSSCSQSAISTMVLDSIDEYKNSLLTEGMAWELWVNKVNQAKLKFSQLINCDPEEVAILSSVSDCVSSVLNALDLEDKEISVTELDFPCIGQSILAQQQKQNFNINYIPHSNCTIPLSYYKEYLSNNIALTCVPHVSYYNGFKQNLKEISHIVHEKNSLLLVDAYQSAGSVDIDVKEMDIDILVTGMQKYLLGAPGISFLYIKKEVANKLYPPTTGWFGQEDPFEFNLKELKYGGATQRFNTGTPPVINAYIADTALSTILSIGVRNIEAYLNELSLFTIEKAKELDLTIISPTQLADKAATTAIYVENASEVEQQMKERNIIVSARQDVIRIAPHFYNTKEEIEYALQTLRSLL